jgi:hypothetical protein
LLAAFKTECYKHRLLKILMFFDNLIEISFECLRTFGSR